MKKNTQMFIKDKSYGEGLCDVVPLFGLPFQRPGIFLNEQTEYLKFML